MISLKVNQVITDNMYISGAVLAMDTSEEGQQSACVLQMMGDWCTAVQGTGDTLHHCTDTDTVTVHRIGDRRRRNVVKRRQTLKSYFGV